VRHEIGWVTGDDAALQPTFHAYVATGLGVASEKFRLWAEGQRPPYRREEYRPRPYVGLGLGWNWLPHPSSAPNIRWYEALDPRVWVALPFFLAGLAVTFAGRIEVRYTASPLDGRDTVTVLTGVGA
jgi:hypothetical protein